MINRTISGFAFTLFTATAVLCAAQSVAQVPGDLDRTFATPDGFIAGITVAPSTAIAGGLLAVQADGKFLVAGTCGSGRSDFCVMRVNADSTFDTTFGGPDSSASKNGRVIFSIGGGNSVATALAIQRGGKIVLAGYCDASGKRQYCIARLNRDGTYDDTFDGPNPVEPGNGRFILPAVVATWDHDLKSVSLNNDDRILLTGSCYSGQGASLLSQACVARLHADGTFDETFDGRNPSTPGNGRFAFEIGTRNALTYATAAALRSDGAIVVAGNCRTAGATATYVCVGQLLANGDVDRSFEGSDGFPGRIGFPMGGTSSGASAIAVQADGKIVVVGQCLVGAVQQICAARIRPNGIRDNTFGGPAGTLVIPIADASANSTSVVVQHDGKLLIAGTCLTNSQSRICLVRLNSDGTLDDTFDGWSRAGNGATVLPPMSLNDLSGGVAVLNDGSIVVAGKCNNGDFNLMCLAKLQGGPFEASRCSLDLDGDGVVLSSTDLLMMTRVARGLSGAGVINSIQFAANATRKTWPEIHRFLTSQCGMSLVP